MKTASFQRGQLLVAALVLIAVVGLMIVTLGYLSVSTESASSLHSQSDQAYSAAKSGVEFSARQYFTGTGCSSLNNANVQVGSAGATFTLTPTLYAPLAPTATSAALTAASSSISVTSTTGYAPNGRLLIDAELINYTGTTATSFTGLTRGANGTTAAGHASGATVSQNVCVIASRGDAGSARRNLVGVLGAGDLTSPGALGTMGVDAMVVYGKGTSINAAGFDRNVYFRLWDPSTSNWGAEQTAQQVSNTSSPIYIVVQFARTRNDALMGVLDGNGQFWLQAWNGRTWTTLNAGAAIQTGLNTTQREFQITYEYTSGRALIVYNNATRNPQYRTWDGVTLSAAASIHGSLGLANYPTSGTRHWFRLAPRNVAGSNDILMMSMDSSQDTYGARWTGAAWNAMGDVQTWDTSVSDSALVEPIDVAWQSNGLLALFAYGDNNNTRQIGYRTWNATTSTLAPTGNGSASSTVRPTLPSGTAEILEWFRLYPGPNNVILAVAQTADATNRPSLISIDWNNGAWDAANAFTVHDSNTLESNPSTQDRNFDFAWEKLPSASGKGWLLWGSNGSSAVRQRYFTSPTTWAAIGTNILDNTLLMQMTALSPSGSFIAGAYESSASANTDTIGLSNSGGGVVWTTPANPCSPVTAACLWTGSTTNIQQGERVFVVAREGARINTGASGTGVVSILQFQEP